VCRVVSCRVPDSAPALLEICKQLGVDAPAPHTTARLVDKLIGACPHSLSLSLSWKGVGRGSNVPIDITGHFIEPDLMQPTFLVDHPHIMSPLAKQHPTKARARSTAPTLKIVNRVNLFGLMPSHIRPARARRRG